MICPECNTEIPKLAFKCPTCVERESEKAYLEFQKQYLPGVLAGIYALTLAKPEMAVRWHIRLVGDPQHAWCGEKISKQWKHRHYMPTKESRDKLCERCAEVLDRMMQEFTPDARS